MNRNSDRAEPPTNFILPQIPRNEFPLERSSAQNKNQSFSVDQQVLFDAYSQLSLELGALLNRVDVSDCYLNVKGTFMAVHKCILVARSAVFSAAISQNGGPIDLELRTRLETLIHKEKLIIKIDKTEPEIMKQVVIFMYTGKCEINDSNSYDLLDAAGRYDIKDLKVHVGRFVTNRINSNNVLTLIRAAYKYENKMVKQYCIQYFIDHAKEIMDIHERWKDFAEQQPDIVADLFHWLVHKEDFYKQKPEWERRSNWS